MPQMKTPTLASTFQDLFLYGLFKKKTIQGVQRVLIATRLTDKSETGFSLCLCASVFIPQISKTQQEKYVKYA